MLLFGREVIGRTLRIGNTVFRVLEVEPYPHNKVSARYREVLSFKPGLIVAVGYRGICIPNITTDGGVVRLTKVEVDGKTFNRPKDISQALGIERPMRAYPLEIPD